MSDILITTYTFKHRQYLIKMNHRECLDMVLTDKQTGEEWECSHDVAYIENLTRKTGNFKQFKIFVTMLKSGLLKTTECVSLDLYTYKDFELMRSRKIKSTTKLKNNLDSNRRYLVLTYCVEFDKINYPLPLDYCGYPDPTILQATIKRLELELSKAREQINNRRHPENKKCIRTLNKQIDDLAEENFNLTAEIKRLRKLLNKNPNNQVEVLQKAIGQLEKSIKYERNSHHKLVDKLQNDKEQLAKQLEHVKSSERMLRVKLQSYSQNRLNVNSRNRCDLMSYEANQLPKRNKDGSSNRRSRSASPRIIHIEPLRNITKRNARTNIPSRSRSHSCSSKKESLSDVVCHQNPNGSSSIRESRTSSPMSRDESLSALSYSSFTNAPQANINTNSRHFLKSKYLENHINKLRRNYM